MVEHLPNRNKALGSSPSTEEKKKTPQKTNPHKQTNSYPAGKERERLRMNEGGPGFTLS